jgi:anti-anti-sigma factor
MSRDQILVAAHGGVCCLKLRGELRHTLGDAIDAIAARMIDAPAPHMVLDLSEASFVDSTVIGLLVGIANARHERGLPPPALACSNPEIVELLHHLRLDEVFAVVDEPEPAPARFAAVAQVLPQNEDPLRQARMILKAHEALIAANAANRDEFAGVVDMFRAEVARLERGAEAGEG